MTDDKKQNTTTTDTGETKKKTLSVGGTLSIGGTLSTSGGSTGGKSGVAVEVRKRRDFSNTAQSAAPVSGELSERARVLEEARKNAELEAKRREEERQRLEALKKEQSADLERKKTAEEERRLKEEEAARLKEEEAKQKAAAVEQKAAAPKAEETPAPAPAPATDDNNRRGGKKHGQSDDFGGKKGGRNAYVEDLEARFRATSRYARSNNKRGGQFQQVEPKEKVIREVTIPEAITVSDLANRMSERVADVVKKFMLMGQMVTQNQIIDQETAALIVEEMGHKYQLVSDADVEEDLVPVDTDDQKNETRPPVVTVMGHVDHGKTTLLDTIRRTAVADKEAGGITQHIGAYQVTNKDKRKITFIDTPGHAAFTSMRARGAAVTDVVILVVAADDGVMPQTVEAIKHARAAGVPIVVAVNKCDKPEANPERVKQELLSHELVAEEFGGDTIFVNVSAKKGTGIEELEEMVLLQADVLDLKANAKRQANGVVVESQLDKGRGPVATVIVQGGTLEIGDILVVGNTWGRVRALVDDHGKRVKKAGPATPVEIIGLQGVPEAGETFVVVENEKKAKEVAEYRDKKKRDAEQAAKAGSRTLENLLAQQTGDQKQLAVVVKGDVQGSVEAIAESLKKQTTDEVAVNVIHSAVGVVTESDVMLASASNAIIIGFNVRAGSQARDLAEREGIEIRYYSIIYNLIDDVKAAMSGLLSPAIDENTLGMAEVREVYKVSKVGTIAGCMVVEGLMRRNAKCRILRDGIVIHDGEIETLKRFKDDAKEVQSGYECGVMVKAFNDIKQGDEIECYELIERAVSIDDLKKASEKEAKAKETAAEEAAS